VRLFLPNDLAEMRHAGNCGQPFAKKMSRAAQNILAEAGGKHCLCCCGPMSAGDAVSVVALIPDGTGAGTDGRQAVLGAICLTCTATKTFDDICNQVTGQREEAAGQDDPFDAIDQGHACRSRRRPWRSSRWTTSPVSRSLIRQVVCSRHTA
jgi:hypothetical protein